MQPAATSPPVRSHAEGNVKSCLIRIIVESRQPTHRTAFMALIRPVLIFSNALNILERKAEIIETGSRTRSELNSEIGTMKWKLYY